jgi:hypothetical protein
LEHDHWIAGLTRQAGAEGWRLRPGEGHEEFGARILGDLMASGKAFPILGGLLMPVACERWTREIGMATAEHLKTISDPEEKKAANSELLTVVMEFFVAGLASWMSSGSSSTEVTGGPAPKNQPRTSSENGGSLSERSAVEITIERGESSPSGRSENV